MTEVPKRRYYLDKVTALDDAKAITVWGPRGGRGEALPRTLVASSPVPIGVLMVWTCILNEGFNFLFHV
jgi:hypothetical protein